MASHEYYGTDSESIYVLNVLCQGMNLCVVVVIVIVVVVASVHQSSSSIIITDSPFEANQHSPQFRS